MMKIKKNEDDIMSEENSSRSPHKYADQYWGEFHVSALILYILSFGNRSGCQKI
jgi:hypothetical protein